MSKNHLTDVDSASAGVGGSPKRPANADTNDVSHIIDDESLRLMLAREAIQFGRLPVRRVDRLRSSPSFGVRCAVCELTVTQEDLGYELEFAQNGHRSVSHHLHVRCFTAWESECRNVRGITDDGALSGNGRATGHRQEPA